MKRKLIDELIAWKTEEHRKVILLTGAKGVGKTYLAYDFAKAFFKHIYYFNVEREPISARLFQGSDRKEILRGLMERLAVTKEEPNQERILLLDEVSFCPELLQLLKEQVLCGEFPYIVAISSNPVPDSDVDIFRIVPVYPMEFDEFLLATGNEWYIEAIVNHFNSNTNIPEIVHKELLSLHRLYLQIGGMPAMVSEYLNMGGSLNVAEQHSFLIGSYHDNIQRDNPDSDALKMNQVFDSLVYQLMKANKKFQYKIIRKGTTHAMYRSAIEKLSALHYVIRCNKISSEQLNRPSGPDLFKNAITEDNTSFKLYFPDTGLLYSRLSEVLGSNGISQYTGALLENYTAQSLQAKNYPFAFWESDSIAKIDFIIDKGHALIPVEIHEDEKTRSKSISVLKQKYDFPYAIKISSRNFEYSNQIKYVPYYAIFCL